MSFAHFEREVAKVNDILCSVNLLTWDSRTMMPPGGVEARGNQIATLVGLARDIATGENMQRAIEGARLELAGVPSGNLRHIPGHATFPADCDDKCSACPGFMGYIRVPGPTPTGCC